VRCGKDGESSCY